MYLLILGPPGAGKGTQGKILAERLGIPKIATGDLLRDAVAQGSVIAREAKGYMDAGRLVPDNVILELVRTELEKPGAAGGAVFDGFPRTIEQAEAVEQMLAERGERISRVLLFDVSEEEIMQRLLRRAAAEGRTDDDPQTIARRLQVYQRSTAPLIAYYAQLGTVHRVPATGPIDEIADRVRRIIGR